jgi:hypothetical protein
MNQLSDNTEEKRLAELSEVENHNLKNRYRHQRRTMDYADAKRMPVDERKVKDMLRNQHIFRHKANEEIGTYQQNIDNPQFENGVLSYLNEAAHGDMRALLNDIGMNRDNLQFMNLSKMRKLSDNHSHDTDKNFKYLMNALFTPVDMTDHEEVFVGWDELPGALPLSDTTRLLEIVPEPHPQSNALAAIEKPEGRTYHGTSPTWQGLIDDRFAVQEPEEDPAYYGDEKDEDDYGDYGAEGGEDAAEEGDDDFIDEDPEEYYEEMAGPEKNAQYKAERRPDADINGAIKEDRYFIGRKELREEFSEVEIGAFMKLLGVKPFRQWQDTSTYHYKLGLHAYEDESQELDPDFHVLSEIERREAEKSETRKFRSGQEIKFNLGKEPIRFNYRF